MDIKKFMGTVANKKYLYDVSDDDIAKYIHLSKRTYLNRRNKPGTFSVDEINAIMRFLKFTEKDKMEVFIQ